MTTLTIKFDEKNATAKKLVDAILASGCVESVKKVTSKKNELDKAIEDVKNGRVKTVLNVQNLCEELLK